LILLSKQRTILSIVCISMGSIPFFTTYFLLKLGNPNKANSADAKNRAAD
jgi:hypothetical protein